MAYPLFKNFYVGGIGSVRGYYPSSIGPREGRHGPRRHREIRWAASRRSSAVPSSCSRFRARQRPHDPLVRVPRRRHGAGRGQSFSASDLRYSTGIGLTCSPIGPLKLSIAFPIRKQVGDRTQRFQFQVGTGF